MIFDKIERLTRYGGLYPQLDQAIAWLGEGELSRFPDGRTEREGNKLYLNRFSYETAGMETRKLESHFHYLDLFIMLSGAEQVAFAPVETLERIDYQEEKDCQNLIGEPYGYIPLTAGQFLLLEPGEGHMANLCWRGSARNEKIVVKICISK